MAEHVELMRSLGYRYDVNEGMLLRFDRFLQSRAELAGKPLNQLIEVWAQSDLSPNRLCEAKRVGQLISKAMHRLDPAATIFPMSIEMFQPVRREQRRPYVYSNEEMQRLLRAALARWRSHLQRRRCGRSASLPWWSLPTARGCEWARSSV
jgi:hypothetical protein